MDKLVPSVFTFHKDIQMSKAKRRPVSTLTHTTREVAIHFLAWREKQNSKSSMIGHNGGPK